MCCHSLCIISYLYNILSGNPTGLAAAFFLHMLSKLFYGASVCFLLLLLLLLLLFCIFVVCYIKFG